MFIKITLCVFLNLRAKHAYYNHQPFFNSLRVYNNLNVNAATCMTSRERALNYMMCLTDF